MSSGAGRGPAIVARLRRLALGDDPRHASRLRFCLVSVALHLAWAMIYFYAVSVGAIAPEDARIMLVSNVVGVLGFYPWVRSGCTARMQDAGLVIPQMIWGSLSGSVAFVMSPTLRPALLQVICLVQVFGFFGLRPRQIAVTGVIAVSLLAGLLVLGASGGIPHFDVCKEAFPLLTSMAILVVITAITVHRSRRRIALTTQKLALQAAIASMRELVIRDTLTGLFSRGHMLELLQRESERAQRTGLPFRVALIDLDHFKRINDTHGHSIGDEVLRCFGDAVREAMQSADSAARWGGEEFLLLMPEARSDTAAVAPLARLRLQVHQPPPSAALLKKLEVTFSAGVAAHTLGDTIEDTIDRADSALYAAKHAGRDGWRVASGEEALAG
ncbi:diguanylate cyclase (GGDEF)-like protein [Variovorax ginsengisoli]|uniref:diguanylate cyclase n=1 Tax=Variovorax ginsengisoli TaxID=363844 RepID=A0ABT9S5T3_9BURK|nr:diguanylate cyclase (GGDEF)-like protein [Variovorax ginsengisoli]